MRKDSARCLLGLYTRHGAAGRSRVPAAVSQTPAVTYETINHAHCARSSSRPYTIPLYIYIYVCVSTRINNRTLHNMCCFGYSIIIQLFKLIMIRDGVYKQLSVIDMYIYILIAIRVSKMTKVTSQALYKKNIEIRKRRRK